MSTVTVCRVRVSRCRDDGVLMALSPLLKYCSYALFTGTVDKTDTGDIISRRIAEQNVLEAFYLCAVDNGGKDLEKVKKQDAKVIEQMAKQDGGTKA